MYSLLVSADPDAWSGEHHVFPTSRFLEATQADLAARFRDLDAAALERLRNMPAVFAVEEGFGDQVRIGHIVDIRSRRSEVRVSFQIDGDIPPLTLANLKSLSWDLDIEGFEYTRTHWAIKPVDLYAVLQKSGLIANPAMRVVSRADVLNGALGLEGRSHTELDRILLEWGVPALSGITSANNTSRAARANAIAKYSLDNPNATTAEGMLLSAAIAKMAGPKIIEEPPTFLFQDYDRADPPPKAKPQAAETFTMQSGDASTAKQRVFIVHGRDTGALNEVARFIEKLGLEAVILHEQPNKGRSIINKFTEIANGIQYAVVIMTPDDEGYIKGEDPTPRARQNVVFELGFFIGKLGADKVCALVSPGVSRPSDFEAVVYISYAPQTNWKVDVAKELHAAGISFDAKLAW